MSESRNLAIVVPAQRWEAALVARTQQSLQFEGLTALAYDYTFGEPDQPGDYRSVLARLIAKAGPSDTLILPAGYIAKPGFGQKLKEALAGEWTPAPANSRQPCFIAAGTSSPTALPDELMRSLREVLIARQSEQERTLLSLYPYSRRREGEELFQQLGADAFVRGCEQPVRTVSPEELAQVREGWVYRCNNEPIEVDLSAVKDCETLVVVGAGIKPWWLANTLKRSLKQMIVVDAHLPQLAFAMQAESQLGRVEEWSTLCDRMPFHSIDDQHLMPTHNRIFRQMRRDDRPRTFEVRFVAANLLTQTFGLLDLVSTLASGKVCFWYSNIFRPYLASGHSEHHSGAEYSFIQLLESAFPRAICLNAGKSPVNDPRNARLGPEIRFRTRRQFDALTDAWRDGGMRVKQRRVTDAID